MPERRIVLLSGSRWSRLGGELAVRLRERGHDVHAVVAKVTLSRARSITFGRVLAKLRGIIKGYVAGAVGLSAPTLASVEGLDVREVDRIGGPESVAALRELAPFLCINTGGCGILGADFLMASGPVLNVHCGLPFTRGFNAVEWTAFHGLPLRFHIHVIDSGIDTGPVVLSRELPLPAEPTVKKLRIFYELHLAAWFLDAVDAMDQLGPAAAAASQELTAGRTYFAMHWALRDLLDHRLARGAAVAPYPTDHVAVPNRLDFVV